MTFDVRLFQKKDSAQLLDMMRALAEFEHYIDDFDMDAQTLESWGLGRDPGFFIFVAVENSTLLAYAAAYTIPYTYDRKLTVVLKEMYANPEARGTGAAHAVMQAVIDHARSTGAARLHWLVLPDNQRAKSFYEKFGGQPDKSFEPWHITFSHKTL